MSDLRILVAEDDIPWQEAVKEILQRALGDVNVKAATTYEEALHFIKKTSYDLMIIDLSLSGAVQQGMSLLPEIRSNKNNKHCAIIILTGFANVSLTNQALRKYDVYAIVEKSPEKASFNEKDFVGSVRDAIWNARLNKAEAQIRVRLLLTITFDKDYIVSSTLTGPNPLIYIPPDRARFVVDDLIRRTDTLNVTLLNGEGDATLWRPEVRSIGKQMYESLSKEQRIQNDLTTAQRFAQPRSNLWLQFSGPAVGLGIPFELMHDGDDYLSLAHVMTRRVVYSGPMSSHKPESFHHFLEDMRKRNEVVRVLMVGANSDDTILAAETEATLLKKAIETDLHQLDILCEVTLLLGNAASYAEVRKKLSDGNYHIFHYAGHGLYNKPLPETSGLILRDGDELRVLTANELYMAARNTELRMAFLSCCLGAYTAHQLGRGDFYGMLQALVNADVPTVLGYRWAVADESARYLAKTFYETLWRTLSPGEALLKARTSIVSEPIGRDDETWVSPVLIAQNG